ncbi:MAG: hypothetical protein ACXADU_18890 [Promethearchaeota archaeon]|jgi:hypothetical protein
MSKRVKFNPKEILIVYGAGLLLTLFAVFFFSIRGYPLVSTATETLSSYTPPLYMIPVFFPYGLLLGEVAWLWMEEKKKYIWLLLFLECIVVGIFSFIRYVIGIPFSGHSILLFFFLSHQGGNNRFRYILRFFIGVIVLTITIIFKIIVWNDLFTFLLGALLGIGLWFPGFIYRNKKIGN